MPFSSSRRWVALACTLAVLVGALARPPRALAADTLTILHSFDEPLQRLANGSDPALTQGTDGNFYGVTPGNSEIPGSYGTVFRLAPDGTYATVHAFNKTDGAGPTAALIQAPDGNFYGTTPRGGSANQGTVFRLAPDGTFTTLHTFGSDVVGSASSNGLTRGADGNFYGVTVAYGEDSRGALFRLTPGGVFSVVHVFAVGEGVVPGLSPVVGTDGNFYGTTSLYSNYFGAVYRITPDGTLSILHGFSNFDAEGGYPGPLIQGNDGALYGTTYGGGPNRAGTVYRLGLDGAAFTVLHGFGGSTDGESPTTALTQAPDGTLYGTTSTGYDNDASSFSGTVFRLAPDGTLTTLHKFTHTYVGSGPQGKLLLGNDGALYGFTPNGGDSNDGTVFRVTTDSVAPVVSAPVYPVVTAAVVGSRKIIGNAGVAEIQLTLSYPVDTDTHVNYNVAGSATPGTDYQELHGAGTIKAGRTTKIFKIKPVSRYRGAPGKKTVEITLLGNTGYTVGTDTTFKFRFIHP